MGSPGAKQKSHRNRLSSAGATRLPDPTALSDGELLKSSRTRTRIMEAAIKCLAEFGYAGTTTTTVAALSRLTRAAMLYHFPSRMALIEAVIYYVTRRRNEKYCDAMADIPHDENFFVAALEKAWEQTDTDEFRAFTELGTAARTDPDLAAVFMPALAEYDRARREAAKRLFPQWMLDQPWLDLRRDITRFLMEGLAQQGGLSFNADKRMRNIMSFLKLLGTSPAGAALLTEAIKGRD